MASDHHRQESVQSLSHLQSPVSQGRDNSDLPFSATRGDEVRLVENILRSEVGVSSLLTRLKQAVLSCRDFSGFLKKRANLEEEHAQGLRKLCRAAYESVKRPDSRQGTYGRQYEEMARIHDRLAENGLQFAVSLHQMHEDLTDLASSMDRSRKNWKQVGMSAEKKVHDAEQLMEKAKAKYDNLTEEYDRLKTGDRRTGKSFGFKGPRSGPQYEEELNRRVAAADLDYASKVDIAKVQRHELVNAMRPQTVKALRQLVEECDSGLTLHLQKFAQLSEKLLLSNGLSVSPIKSQDSTDSRSLRDVVCLIDTDKDFKSFMLSFSGRVTVPSQDLDPKNEAHMGNHQASAPIPDEPYHAAYPPPPEGPKPPQGDGEMHPSDQQQQPLSHGQQSPISQPGPPTINPYQPPKDQPAQGFGAVIQQPVALPPQSPREFSQTHRHSSQPSFPDLPPLKPVFGVSLDALLTRDDTAVPIIVYQCIQAVDLYGLNVEGIYRLSGESKHVERIKARFNNNARSIDFRRPEDFYHDVNSAASVLKQFFRDLPAPLLTNELYRDFIAASRIDDDIARRDSLHGLINQLPDPNYATLRVLVLHLNRVQEHSNMNRMNCENLAISFGPTLMTSSSSDPNTTDLGWQIRVMATILQNCFSIFHDD